MKKKYGSIFTLWLPEPTIMVCGSEQLKTAFVKNGEKTAGRPNFKIMELHDDGNYGLVFSDDSFWKSQRRFALRVLRDFGFGRPILENAILQQASDACNYFRSLNGEPVDVNITLSACVGNIIHQLVFGSTVSFDEYFYYDFKCKLIESERLFFHPLTFFMNLWKPLRILKFLGGSSYQKMINYNDELLEYYKKQLKEHRTTINYDNEPRDYIDAFLIEQKKQNSEGVSTEFGEWSDLQLLGTVYDLFAAGTEAVSSTLTTFILYMIHYPKIKQEIYEEIDRVIGREKVVTMSDQPKLPYFNACLLEAQRIITSVPINAFHRTFEEFVIDGYTIPKGINIIPQFEAVHKDEIEFPDPWTFDPLRFLDEEMNYKKDERVTPFSLGKRACLGESLVRMELFLFAATFAQNFDFQPADPKNLPLFEFEYTITKNIKSFNVRLINRK
uniref:Cytochrome P450 n=1 Tax=Panagrolaimus davidi TaxID=227884 RepID=A0A914PAB8_9BILA